MLVSRITDLEEEQEVISLNQQYIPRMETVETEEPKKEEVESIGVAFEMSSEMKSLYQQQTQATKSGANATDDMTKMMEIARRISNGDAVPAFDEKRLMEYNGELYQAAKATSILYTKEERTIHDSVFEESENSTLHERIRNLERDAGDGWQVDVESSDSTVTVAGADLKKN